MSTIDIGVLALGEVGIGDLGTNIGHLISFFQFNIVNSDQDAFIVDIINRKRDIINSTSDIISVMISIICWLSL